MNANRLVGMVIVGAMLTLLDSPQSASAQRPIDTQIAKAEQWYRIYLKERSQGKWRPAGTFENPSYDRCVRYGDSWKEVAPNDRSYSGPYGFRQ